MGARQSEHSDYPHLTAGTKKGGDSTAVLAAGLPNATGATGTFRFTDTHSPTNNGVFQTPEGSGDKYVAMARTEQTSRSNILSFALSNANAIYGASSTVQPPALSLIPQIKY